MDRKCYYPGGGHSIKNDSGTTLAQKNNLKFTGTYSANSGDDSVINISRTMTSADYALLSSEEKKGLINVTDESGNPFDADDIPYDNDNSVADALSNIISDIGTLPTSRGGNNLVADINDLSFYSLTYDKNPPLNLNNCKNNSFCWVNDSQSTHSNMPIAGSAFHILTITTVYITGQNYGFQIAVNYSGIAEIYIRVQAQGTWQAWKKWSLTSL